jgi:hypothetical protein
LSGDPFDKYEVDPEALRKLWGETAETAAPAKPNGLDSDEWGTPDMGVLRQRRRDPVPLPIEVFKKPWGSYILDAAASAACPPDYVSSPLLAIASVLIGHARWAQGGQGWAEPPHLWPIVIGDSGDGKSAGSDVLMREVVTEIERRMIGDFPERHSLWRAAIEADKAALKRWEKLARQAGDPANVPPMPTPLATDVEPERPRLRQHDVTIEQVAVLLASAAPKGLLIVRDEISGWLDGMNVYNPAGRPFWVEAYGGRPYRVERRKHTAEPINIPRLAVAVSGGTQPDKLAGLLAGADDGLLARIQWAWPNPVPFKLGRSAPRTAWAIETLDRLRELEMMPGDPPSPIFTPLVPEARELLEMFGQEMQARQENAGGLLRSDFLWCSSGCGGPGRTV